MEAKTQVAVAGLVLGILFGALAERTGFCLMRGLQSWWTRGDRSVIAAFALALAVAVAGTQAMAIGGWIDPSQSLYLRLPATWLLVPAGGLLFGYGMVAANGCGARALVLLGGGNLRSFVVLVCLGVSAYAVLTGVLAPLRLWLVGSVQATIPALTLPALIARLGLEPGIATGIVTGITILALLAFALRDPAHRPPARQLWGALAIGALVPLGWLATSVLGADDFDPAPLVSLTFVAPVGAALQYLMIATGASFDFAIASVAGVLLGAAVAARLAGTAVLRGFDGPRHMLRLMAGGALMGIGGALALGCSIGQGLTGLSTLALPSLMAAAGILAGARFALKGRLALATL